MYCPGFPRVLLGLSIRTESEGPPKSLVSATLPDMRGCASSVSGTEPVNRWGERRRSRARPTALTALATSSIAGTKPRSYKWGNRDPGKGGGLSSSPSELAIARELLPPGSSPLLSTSVRKARNGGALNLVIPRSLGKFSCRKQAQREPGYYVHLCQCVPTPTSTLSAAGGDAAPECSARRHLYPTERPGRLATARWSHARSGNAGPAMTPALGTAPREPPGPFPFYRRGVGVQREGRPGRGHARRVARMRAPGSGPRDPGSPAPEATRGGGYL